MVTEMINIKLETKFLKEIDSIVKKENYQNRTEFIRSSLRENVDKARMKQAMLELQHLKGASKRKITPEEYEIARERAFEEIAKKFK
ncbi:MAG: ribbon-helix-helix domain-containing protein [Nanoarchaeota archaeon]|nr:ribbon-helix-helix domain-containing protein [Nanoarchaeota archaeon]